MNEETKITYSYHDEHGNELYKKIRLQKNDGSKSFYFEREENGKTIKNMDGQRQVLYQLPQVLEGIKHGDCIYLVEGEKDAETLIERGFRATTAPSTLVWDDSYAQTLKGCRIGLLYDNDKAGIKRRDLIASHLSGHVKSLRIVDLPGIEYTPSHGKDITDWFEDPANTMHRLIEITNETPEYKAPLELPTNKHKGPLRVITINELMTLNLPEREMLLHPFLPSQGLVMLAAKRGVGKTHVALGIAYAVANGTPFLNWYAPSAKKVLYIDGEMPAVQMQERLRIIAQMNSKQPDDEYLQFITPDLQDRPIPDLSTKAGRETFEEYIGDRDLIVIDNLSCLFRSGNENDAECWQEAQEWALDLRRRGKSILFVHHTGKSGTQRGTSKKEDILDAIILLKHPDNYKASEGARFEVHFDKARHFSGEAAQSFEACLKLDGERYAWHISSDDKGELIQRVAQMRANGSTIQHVMQLTGLTKSQVETLSAKARSREAIA